MSLSRTPAQGLNVSKGDPPGRTRKPPTVHCLLLTVHFPPKISRSTSSTSLGSALPRVAFMT